MSKNEALFYSVEREGYSYALACPMPPREPSVYSVGSSLKVDNIAESNSVYL